MIIKRGQIYPIVKITSCGLYGLDLDNNKEDCWWFTEEMLEPLDADGSKIAYAPNGAPLFRIPTPEKPVSIDIQPLELVYNKEQAKELAERLDKELAGLFNAFPNNCISAKNGGKNSMKFTFYVTEGTRPDKSCNGTIPTMTTMVSYIDKYGCIMKGTATCDKADYDERQGVLEAFANATCGNDFYKAYAEAVKEKKHRDITDRTCTYCGKVLDTVEEKEEHEAWHVECRKARHERYLLRKRAKEIAFEEQAQKMAKEMMGEQK
jgi:hypothetical protein